MKRIYFLILILTFPFALSAQQRNVSGKVTDKSNGSSLPGVSVFVNTSAGRQAGGVSTNSNGEYTISVPANATGLVFVFVGMQNVTEAINGRSTINVNMVVDNKQLEEVVITGYGNVQTKTTVTGAVSSINNKDIQTSTNTSVAQDLQGKVAGLNIRQNSGQPGTFNNNINVRGFTRIDDQGRTVLAQPLIVIDGVVRDDGGAFQRLNPDDIENITVLKDASASVYGLAGANGVLIVTTKKGNRDGTTTFSASHVTGITKPVNFPQPATTAEYAQMINDAGLYSQTNNFTPTFTKDELQKYIDGTLPGYQNVDMINTVMKPSSMQNQTNFAVRGGNEKTGYYISLGFQEEGGMLRSDDMGYNKYNFNTRLTTELTKNLTADVVLNGYRDKRWEPGNNFFNLWKMSISSLPTQQAYANNDPNYFGAVSSQFGNPAPMAQRDVAGYTDEIGSRLNSNANLSYNTPFIKGLTLKTTLGYDMGGSNAKALRTAYNVYSYNTVTNQYVAAPAPLGGPQNLDYIQRNSNRLYLNGSVNYQTQLDKHSISGMVLYENIREWSSEVGANRRYGDFYTNDLNFNNIGLTDMSNRASEGRGASLGYVGRLSYSYASKYNLDLSARYNGSSLYAPGKRWMFFPVVGASWVLSEEKFIKDKLTFVSLLKLRASHGKNAVPTGGAYQWLPGFTLGGTSGGLFEFSNNQMTNGLAAPQVANNRLTWADTRQTDIGIDASLWQGKLTFGLGVYRKDVTGLAATPLVQVPNTFGGSLPQENFNSNRLDGIELELGHGSQLGELGITVRGNVNFARRQTLFTLRGPFTSQLNYWQNATDGRWGQRVNGYILEGQFQSKAEINDPSTPLQSGGNVFNEQPGNYRYRDWNEDGVIDGQDDDAAYAFGSTNGAENSPLMNYGATISLKWKGFDMNMLFQGQALGSIKQTEMYSEIFAFGGTNINTMGYFFDRWRQADPYDQNSAWIPGKWPASRRSGDIGSAYAESAAWRVNSSYVRLKNLSLGYSFNPRLLKSVGVQSLRVYADGFNLITISNPFMKLFDPEKEDSAYAYPLTRNYNFGVSLNF